MGNSKDRQDYFKAYYKLHKDKIKARVKQRKEDIKNGIITPQTDLYSLDDLKHIEERFPLEEGRIDWDVWDKAVKQTREIIQYGDILLNDTTYKGKIRRIYNANGQLLMSGSAKLLETKIKAYMNLSWEVITQYCNKNYYRSGLFFTNIAFKSENSLKKAIQKAINERKNPDLRIQE